MKNLSFFRLAAGAAMIASLVLPASAGAAAARKDLRGKILLQVEDKGQAWYVLPDSGERISLGRPSDAFAIMRAKGVGITNANIWLIPIGYRPMTGADADGDGLTDAFEDAVGTNKNSADTDGDGFSDKSEIEGQYNPYSASDKKKTGSEGFAAPNSGRIFLQVEGKGEAWWVNPNDHKRYFLGRPADAFDVMRAFGLGISNKDLATIDVATVAVTSVPTPAVPTPTPVPTPSAPTPVGSGYTLTTIGMVAPEYLSAGWAGVFADGTYSEPFTVTNYVDDVTRTSRMDVSYGGQLRYSAFRSVDGATQETLHCSYGTDTSVTPKCLLSKGTYFKDRSDTFPSDSAKASVVNATSGKLADRTVDGYETQCYNDGAGMTGCYYGDLQGVQLYLLGNGLEPQSADFLIGRPDTTRLVRPGDYDALATISSAPSPVGSGYTMTTTIAAPTSGTTQSSIGNFNVSGDGVSTIYVDDVGLTVRYASVYGGKTYDVYGTVSNGSFDMLTCGPLAEGSARRPCYHTVVPEADAGLASFFPSKAEKPSTKFADEPKLADRQIAGQPASCYGNAFIASCFLADNSAVTAFQAVGVVPNQRASKATSYAVGRPEASLLARPSEYELLQ